MLRQPRPQKRRRPALACEQCRARKVRCDRTSPCATCLRTNTECTYTPLPPPRPKGGNAAFSEPRSTSRSLGPPSLTTVQIPERRESLTPGPGAPALSLLPPNEPLTPSAASARASSATVISSLELRITQLEKEVQLSKGHATEPAGAFDNQGPKEIEKNFVPLQVRGTMSKTRFFGHSHWANGVNMIPPKYKALLHLMDRAQHEKTSKIYPGFQRCKALARAVKKARVPRIPGLSIGQNIPDRPIADCFVDGYLRTFETIYRVLHVPSFQAEYERYWHEPKSANQPFIVLMQLCMAIGACFHDNKHSFRAHATGWIYEARLWLLISSEKSQLSIAGLQILCLLHLAKQTTGLASGLAWISVGSLLRVAMSMGLQYDPESLVGMSPLRVELRRRLWATILEINLQASLDAGALPLILSRDFNTRPPRNLPEQDLDGDVDQQLVSDTGMVPYTQTSAQIALLRSFTTRLAIANLVNQSDPPEYEKTLELSSDLIASTRTLMQQLHNYPRDEQGISGTSPFQLRFLEMTMNRYLLALHLPWWNKSLLSPAHYFSHKTSVDAARRLVSIYNIGAPNPSPSLTDFDRLLVCGSEPFRSTLVNACLTLTLEYLHLKEEEQRNKEMTTAAIATRETAELHAIFDWQADWWARRIRAGETNIKSYAFGRVFDSLMEALKANLGPEETMRFIMEHAIERVEECYQMLREAAGEIEVDLEAVDESPLDARDEPLDDDLSGLGPYISFLDDLQWDEALAGLNSFDLFFK